MSRWTAQLCVKMLVGGLISSTFANDSVETQFASAQSKFEQAMSTYRTLDNKSDAEVRRQFREAAAAFEAIAHQGVASANLYINTGNAYHFAGDNPRALLWYRRAVDLENSAEARSGLASLRRLCGVQLWANEATSITRILMFWHDDLGRRTKQLVLLSTWPIGCVLLAISFFVARRIVIRRLAWLLIAVGLAFGVSDLVLQLRPPPPSAVILEQTKGRAGDNETYSITVERIVAGQEVKLLETRGDWLRIRLPSGTTCWVPAVVGEEV